MTTFQTHTLETAPGDSRPLLERAQKTYGAIPNLLAIFAESPALLGAYLQLGELFDRQTAFDATERQVVLMSASYENECGYCMAAHSAIALRQGVAEAVVEGLRDGTHLADAKLEALRDFVRAVVRKRGWVAEDEVETFLAAGYTQRHVLEVILGIGMKLLSNFTNHIAKTPLDHPFQSLSWTRPADSTSA